MPQKCTTVNRVLDFTEKALKTFESLTLDNTFVAYSLTLAKITSWSCREQSSLEGDCRGSMSNKSWYITSCNSKVVVYKFPPISASVFSLFATPSASLVSACSSSPTSAMFANARSYLSSSSSSSYSSLACKYRWRRDVGVGLILILVA